MVLGLLRHPVGVEAVQGLSEEATRMQQMQATASFALLENLPISCERRAKFACLPFDPT